MITIRFYCEKYHTSVLGAERINKVHYSVVLLLALPFAGDPNDNINIFDSISLNETVDYELI